MAGCGRMLTLTRHFSTTGAVNAGLVKPPLAVFGIEGRYATAMYSAASKEKKLDVVEKELIRFKGMMEQDVKLAQFIENPLVNKLVKRDALQDALKKLQFSSLTVNLIVDQLDEFTILFDKSLNDYLQKKQVDIHLRFWSTTPKRVTTQYHTSVFHGTFDR
ncbi:hypothetical protein HPB50_024101 [Hyalomma asiaticum]|uniref:Uncharacterized protein n=1 Tax=Hyalomma asiaticum TaxID=266040 RepID=A0ACB7S2L4_HYAAI|nr:hypothetical protein HPB50_024101 [Hyalomma asiaticum]